MKALELNTPGAASPSILHTIGRQIFWLLVWLGKPWGGIRPRRIYYYLGRWLFSQPEFQWYRHKAGFRMLLSPHLYMDRVIISHGQYDDTLHKAIGALVKPGMVCMDIGANMGEFTLHLAHRVGPTGKVFSFEPVPLIRERLSIHIKENSVEQIVQICPIALSDQNGQVDINFANDLFENQGMASIVNTQNPDVPLSVKVATLTMDQFVRDNNISHLDFIKIDTQGAEPLILRGAKETLRSLQPILLMEISPQDLSCLGLTSPELIKEIQALGYRVYEISDALKLKNLDHVSIPKDFEASNVFCVPNNLPLMTKIN